MRDEAVQADALLWEAMVDGDRVALARLYDRHAPGLLALAFRVLGSAPEAEDLVHDVLLEAWESGDDFDPRRGTVRTWLAVRTRSRALDRLRARGRRREVEPPPGGEEPGRVAPDDPSLAPDQRRLRAALVDLPETQRAVLALAYFEGWSASEIAENLQLPIGTVKSRTAAGLSRLRAMLEADEAGSAREGGDR
jgi:RNA polymerase sigma-70 factor (ECF subfamily)